MVELTLYDEKCHLFTPHITPHISPPPPRWYTSWVNIFKKKQEPARPPARTTQKTRRRASCGDCSREYCMECKMLWHTGDCCVVDEKALEDQVRSSPLSVLIPSHPPIVSPLSLLP